MKKFLLYLLVLCLLTTCLVPGSGRIVQAQAEFPLPDGEIMPSSDVDVEIQTLADVESFNCSDVTDVSVSECEALVAFYLSTNGAGWSYNTNWLESSTVGTWFGVTVEERHVTILSLYSKNLTGTIPEEIGQLPYLELLELAGNQLTGPIPESLGNLTYLVEACLTNNLITGPIPDTLGGMSSLLKLSFNDNLIEGEIPASLGNISTLTKFSLGNNRLTGTIPDSLGQLINVDRLEVYKNNLSGELPESLGNLTLLKEFIIFENSFSGSIPISYTNLTSVTAFYFFNTQLCEPTTPEFLAWKALVGAGWHGNDQICMDFHHYLPIIYR
jgi:Leucine-rich repeat (LRR) protein